MKPRTLKKFKFDYEEIKVAPFDYIEKIIKQDFAKLLILWLDYYEEQSCKHVYNQHLEDKAYYLRLFLQEFLDETDIKIPDFSPKPKTD